MVQVTAAGSREEDGEELYIERFSRAVAAAFEVAPAWMTVEVDRRAPWFSARVHLEADSASDAESLIREHLDLAVDRAAEATSEDFAYTCGLSEPEVA